MTRTRVFYGHGAPVPPTGLRAREAAPAAAADITAEPVDQDVEVATENAAVTVDEAGGAHVGALPDEVVVDDLADDAPDGSWSHAEIDAYAEAHGISLDGAKKKSEKLALIEYALEGD